MNFLTLTLNCHRRPQLAVEVISASDLMMWCALIAGVSVIKGQEEVHVHAPIVISNAGIFNTYQQLLPKEVQTRAGETETAGKQRVMRNCLVDFILSICSKY